MERFKALWTTLPPWQKTVVLAIIPVLLIGIIWYYLITPTRDEIETLKAQENKLKSEINNLKKLANPKILEPLRARIKSLKQEEEKLISELQQEVGKIPSEEDLEEVLKNIYRLSKISKVALLDAKFSKPQKVIYEIKTVEGKKIVSERQAVQRQARRSPPRRPVRGRGPRKPQQEEKKPVGVEFYKSELKLSIRGKTKNIFRFMKLLEEKGIPSYPSSLSMKPGKDNIIKADVVLVLILQRKENKEGAL